MSRVSHPRINCVIPGCKRGTTRCAPRDDGALPQIICGKHWRTVPKAWRQVMSGYGRVFRRAERRGDERVMQMASRSWWRGWNNIVETLSTPGTIMSGDLPATVAEVLRRDGLL